MRINLEGCPNLSPRELHLWRVELDQPSPALELWSVLLSHEELRRAQRFVRETDGRRFIVGHAALRMILARYLGVPPGRIAMTVRQGGKPGLAPPTRGPRVCFNLSHSEGLQLVAVALDREVGVDVERVRPIVDLERIVERHFAPGERATWQALSGHERLAAFFRCWTRKEAYLKARGIGLSLGLDQFEVSLAPGEPAKLLSFGKTEDAGAHWDMYDVSPGDGYVAACVVEPGIETLSAYDWRL